MFLILRLTQGKIQVFTHVYVQNICPQSMRRVTEIYEIPDLTEFLALI